MGRERGEPSPARLQRARHRSGATYPVSKADLVRIADEEGADEAVRATLARLPERQYDSLVAVSEEIGEFE